uniref:Uncharacterized protein n=1 Tax=Trypanosoma vivax (strain Y486) TaxID=1055687 RepID=G0TU59_TRYVY|nr:hypothetical protein TVY486_0401590 [Trypanosoma vivax Y486]
MEVCDATVQVQHPFLLPHSSLLPRLTPLLHPASCLVLPARRNYHSSQCAGNAINGLCVSFSFSIFLVGMRTLRTTPHSSSFSSKKKKRKETNTKKKHPGYDVCTQTFRSMLKARAYRYHYCSHFLPFLFFDLPTFRSTFSIALLITTTS